MVNWRVHKALVLVILGLIGAGLLDIIHLNEIALFIQWKYLLVGGTAYVFWAFLKMLHF
jgi:hypothetical protein